MEAVASGRASFVAGSPFEVELGIAAFPASFQVAWAFASASVVAASFHNPVASSDSQASAFALAWVEPVAGPQEQAMAQRLWAFLVNQVYS